MQQKSLRCSTRPAGAFSIYKANEVPSITIHHTWADKDIGHNCGERTYQSGVETQEHLPTGQEAVELGCDLWDIDPEEFLCENQDSGMKIT